MKMKARRWKILLFATTLLLIGTFVGPVAQAAVQAALSDAHEKEPRNDAHELVESYLERTPSGVLYLSMVAPENGAECGYDGDEFFPDGLLTGDSDRYRDYQAYLDLFGNRLKAQTDQYYWRVGDEIRANLSPFEIAFLDRCIERTVFADVCAKRVRSQFESVSRFRDPYLARQDAYELNLLCTYVDAIAAKRGIEKVEKAP